MFLAKIVYKKNKLYFLVLSFSTLCIEIIIKKKKKKKFFAISFIIEAKSFINEGRKKAKINKSNINASLIF